MVSFLYFTSRFIAPVYRGGRDMTDHVCDPAFDSYGFDSSAAGFCFVNLGDGDAFTIVGFHLRTSVPDTGDCWLSVDVAKLWDSICLTNFFTMRYEFVATDRLYFRDTFLSIV